MLLRIRFVITAVLLVALLAGAAVAQNYLVSQRQAVSQTQLPQQPTAVVRAFPRLQMGEGRELDYVGAFFPDGKFKGASKFGYALDRLISASVPYQAISTQAPPDPQDEAARDIRGTQPAMITDSHSSEWLVEDLEPPAQMVAPAKKQPLLRGLRDAIVRLFDQEDVMVSPLDVITDSRQRVIITDPVEHAVHVLDYAGKDSFRIVGGPGRRLQIPVSAAVDKDDNLYISDCARGMILVYGPEGNFLRYIGDFKGENFYQCPTGLAIDRSTDRLYVLDTPVHLLYMLDLQGHILARIGSRGGGTGKGEFEHPTAIAIHHRKLFVLDANGSRLQVLDLQGNFRREFRINQPVQTAVGSGLSLDPEGNIYLADNARGMIRVYDRHGVWLTSFGRPGERPGEFISLAGIWVDSSSRIYAADSANLPVQVFQLREPQR